jgi:hypothetical protein
MPVDGDVGQDWRAQALIEAMCGGIDVAVDSNYFEIAAACLLAMDSMRNRFTAVPMP